MRKGILTLICLVALMFGSAGCIKEYLVGAGIGAAGVSALDATETALIEQGVALEADYEAAVVEVEKAADPNALALAEEKLEIISKSRLVNRGSLITVQTLKKAAAADNPKDRTDAVVVGIGGIIGIAIEEWRRRLKGKKYTAMKIGQAKLKTANPEAEAQLYALTGEERRKLGL